MLQTNIPTSRGWPVRVTPAPHTKPTPFALVSCQRSGTHLFEEIFNSNPCAALLIESFCSIDKDVYWPNYLHSLPPSRFPPQFPANAMELLDGYFDRLQRDTDDDVDYYGGPKRRLTALGWDVKYNQLRCLTPQFRDLRSPPILLDYFRSRKFCIIHLVRNNIVHAALSLIVAKWRNVWVNTDRTTIEGRYHVSWQMLRDEMTWIAEERDEFLRLAHGLPIQTCTYEDLVGDVCRAGSRGEIPADSVALRPVAEFLGLPNLFRYAGTQRKVINRPYAEIIEDYDGLVQALRDSEYAEFADTI